MKLNIPNKLTLLRIVVIPFFIVFICYDFFGGDDSMVSRIVAGVLFIGAAVTDFFDGYIARKHNLITDFGKFMDPLADKFLVFGALIAACKSGYIFDYDGILSGAMMEDIFFWIAILVIFRELAVTSMRLVVAKSDGIVVAASMLGKIKTTAQIVCVSLVILEPVIFPVDGITGIFSLIAMLTMLIFTLWSGINYIAAYWVYLDPNT